MIRPSTSWITNKRFIQGVGFAGVAAVLAAFGVAALQPSPARILAAPPPPNVRGLTNLLERCRSTWHPEGRQRLLQSARERTDTLESPLVWVLGQPDHPCLEEAIWLAAGLGLPSTLPPLHELVNVGPPPRRALALGAAEAVAPWHDGDLMELLTGNVKETRLGALHILRARLEAETSPLSSDLHLPICWLMEHDDPDVREAAGHALPLEVSGEALGYLHERARATTGEVAQGLLAALGRILPSAEAEAILTERILGIDPVLAVHSLDVLATWSSDLADAAAIGAIAEDPNSAVPTRAAALHCIEVHRAFAAVDWDALLPTLPAELFLPAARGLLSTGDARGLDLLIDLLDLEPSRLGGLTPAEQTRDLTLARRILCQITGLSPQATTAAFRQWRGEDHDLGPMDLTSQNRQ